MGSILDALRRLQGIELRLAAIRTTSRAKGRQLQALNRKVQAADQELEECRRGCREQQMKLDDLTLDSAAREEVIQKHRQALAKAKTNKEYAAILTAMNTEKADNSKIETEALQIMEVVQTIQGECAECEAKKARLLEKVAAGEAALQAYEEESRESRERLEGERAVCAEDLPPAAIAAFNRVAEHHDGEAMAPLTRLSSRREEYICGGCNMQVTLEAVNTLRTRDEMQLCTVCGRLLYLPES